MGESHRLTSLSGRESSVDLPEWERVNGWPPWLSILGCALDRVSAESGIVPETGILLNAVRSVVVGFISTRGSFVTRLHLHVCHHPRGSDGRASVNDYALLVSCGLVPVSVEVTEEDGEQIESA